MKREDDLFVQLTDLVQHLVALVKNELGDVTKTQLLVPDKGVQATGGGDDNVRVSLLAGQDLDVLLQGSTTVEDGGLDIRHVLAETSVLVLDLVSKLASVAHDEDGSFAIYGLNLLEGCEDEDGRLSQSGLGLAEDIGTQDGLRDANLLDWISHLMSELFRVNEVAKAKSSRGLSVRPSSDMICSPCRLYSNHDSDTVI